MKAALRVREEKVTSIKMRTEQPFQLRKAELAPRIKVKVSCDSKVIDLASLAAANFAKGAPTTAQQEALIIKYRTKARKLGRSILRRWHSRLELDEVDSLVDLSLCEAVKRFNPYKGAAFMTFLYYHLKGNLVRAVATAASSHSVPVFLPLEDFEVERAEKGHFNGFQHRAMTAGEVAEALCHEEAPLPDELLWRKELHTKSASACAKLDTLEQEIIKRLFVQEQQIMDIAANLGYSRCHISRVKKKALETLHSAMSLEMGIEDIGMKPDYSDDFGFEKKASAKKTTHRRRPRSLAVRTTRVLVGEHAA